MGIHAKNGMGTRLVYVYQCTTKVCRPTHVRNFSNALDIVSGNLLVESQCYGSPIYMYLAIEDSCSDSGADPVQPHARRAKS